MTSISDSSSDDIWAAFDASEKPAPYVDPRWKAQLEEAEMKARHAEELYKNALLNGLPPSVTNHLSMEVTYAKRAIQDLHDDRLRRENNG